MKKLFVLLGLIIALSIVNIGYKKFLTDDKQNAEQQSVMLVKNYSDINDSYNVTLEITREDVGLTARTDWIKLDKFINAMELIPLTNEDTNTLPVTYPFTAVYTYNGKQTQIFFTDRYIEIDGKKYYPKRLQPFEELYSKDLNNDGDFAGFLSRDICLLSDAFPKGKIDKIEIKTQHYQKELNTTITDTETIDEYMKQLGGNIVSLLEDGEHPTIVGAGGADYTASITTKTGDIYVVNYGGGPYKLSFSDGREYVYECYDNEYIKNYQDESTPKNMIPKVSLFAGEKEIECVMGDFCFGGIENIYQSGDYVDLIFMKDNEDLVVCEEQEDLSIDFEKIPKKVFTYEMKMQLIDDFGEEYMNCPVEQLNTDGFNIEKPKGKGIKVIKVRAEYGAEWAEYLFCFRQ